MQRPAGHKAIQKPHLEGCQPSGPGDLRQPPDPGQRRQQGQHIQPHQDHGSSGQQLDGPLDAVAQAPNSQQSADPAHDGTQTHIGQQPPQLILQRGSKRGLLLFDSCQALTQANAAAHGHAMDRRHEPRNEEHTIAHVPLRQPGGHQDIENSKTLQQEKEAPQRQQLPGKSAQLSSRRGQGCTVAHICHRLAQSLRAGLARVVGDLRPGLAQVHLDGPDPRLPTKTIFDPLYAELAGHAPEKNDALCVSIRNSIISKYLPN